MPMSNQGSLSPNGSSPESPRPVIRGVKNQLCHLGIDSLYLIVEYPHLDVFEQWSAGVTDFGDPALYEGIPFGEMVLKRGGNGYKLSVWMGDARLFVTNRVADALQGTPQEGHGMGLMLQLGPKWLCQFGHPEAPKMFQANIYGQLILFGIKNPENYPIRINRLDIALDVLGLAVSRFSLDEWRFNWVGRAKLKNFHFAHRSGDLTGFTTGSYKGNTSLRVYDKVVESQLDGDSRFWRSVWNTGEDDDIQVTRFEWTFRCYQARFRNMRYLSEFSFEGFLGLLNYATEKWGRLCVPQEDESHKSRWPLAPLWADLRAFIDDWSLNYDQYTRPKYDLNPDIKAEYLNSAAGWMAGLQARVGLELKLDGPASLAQVFSFMHNEGHTIADIERKAGKKWDVFSRLAGSAAHE